MQLQNQKLQIFRCCNTNLKCFTWLYVVTDICIRQPWYKYSSWKCNIALFTVFIEQKKSVNLHLAPKDR